MTGRTDARGRVRVAVPESLRQGECSLLVMRRGKSSPPAYLGAAHVKAPGEMKPGRRDLGDVQLREESIVVAGRVVDDRGAPVSGAHIEANVEYADGGVSWSVGGVARRRTFQRPPAGMLVH